MINIFNQNNSKSFVVVNQNLTNKKVQKFIHQDFKQLRLKKKNLNELFKKVEQVSQISQQKNFFQQNIGDDDKYTIELINQTYQLKKQELEENPSKNNSRCTQNVFRKRISEKSLREKKDVNKLTSISKINLTQNDDSLLSDHSIKLKQTSQTQSNLNQIRFLQQNFRTQSKLKLSSKKIEVQKNEYGEIDKLPQIWQQYYNIQPEKVKIQVKNSFIKLNDQFKEMEREKVLEPFLKDQKLKVKFIKPLIIRKDKPYFVAENKDNKNLIDNMKNENINLKRDQYLIVNYDNILDYI
ncbi:unnamed protein product [Paramecium primaurelia]|uniref:Uncharacterized protein n=1 Tax=Paramecium primaurelia TaxID=5886 RepID=A0A8S1LMZ1_PARPR|nr:unnamed protein product [Paramecium primaurelia]